MQGVLDFDLSAKLGAVGRLNAPLAVRRLLAALAVFGCQHPQRVAVGDGDEDSGEWLVDASKRELESASGFSRSAVKKWLRLCAETAYMAITKSTDQAHTYYVRWPVIFASAESDPGHFEKVTRVTRKSDPGHSAKVTRVTSPPDNGVGEGDLKPTKEIRSLRSTTPTNQAGKSAFEGKGRRSRKWSGKSIAPHHLRSPEGAWEVFEHAVRIGMVDDGDAVYLIAFLHWVSRQPEGNRGLRDKPAFVVAMLNRGRPEWGMRAEQQDYVRAREIVGARETIGAGR